MDTTKEMTGIPNIYTALCSTSWTGGPSKCVTIRDCILEGIEDYHTNPSRPQLKVLMSLTNLRSLSWSGTMS